MGKEVIMNYTLEKAVEAANLVKGFFKPEWIDEALLEAAQLREFTDKKGPIHLYFPCNVNSLEGLKLLLEDPKKASLEKVLKEGAKAQGRPVYSSWEEALRGVIEKINMPHTAFLVYNHNFEILVDCVNRDGKSLIPKPNRKSYLGAMQLYLNRSLEWTIPNQ